jgi:phage terminase large subunit-like protein
LELDALLLGKQPSQTRQRLREYRPYARQQAFHAAGALHRERLLMAANQVGKSWCGAAEAAIHATGEYPDWWEGRRFDRPTRGWAASMTAEVARDTVQRLLLGDARQEAARGSGFLPAERITGSTRRSGAAGALDSVSVRHASGGVSIIGFKSYDQGRMRWQGETLDWVWLDEEPPLALYMEAVTRTNTTLGPVWITFTPLLGMSEVVRLFLDDAETVT